MRLMGRRGLVMAIAAVWLQTAAFADTYLQAGADRLFFVDAGRGEPIVLLAGGGGMDLRQWDAVSTELAPHFRVLRLDPRGVGRSDNPSETFSTAADVIWLLDSLAIRRAAIGVFSSAGPVAFEIAAAHPERVSAILAIAPAVPGYDFSDAMLARLQLIGKAAQQGHDAYLDAMFADAYFMPAPQNRGVRAVARENMGENFAKRQSVNATLQRPPLWPSPDELKSIATPVLLLAGELEHPDVRRRNQTLLAALPQATEQIIPASGHSVALENPAALSTAGLAFLQRFQTASPANPVGKRAGH